MENLTYNACIAYIMLTILIPGLPFMMIMALQNNPNQRLSNWLQTHRRQVLIGYMVSRNVTLLIATAWLSAAQIWAFIKYATAPILLFTGAVMYPCLNINGRDCK